MVNRISRTISYGPVRPKLDGLQKPKKIKLFIREFYEYDGHNPKASGLTQQSAEKYKLSENRKRYFEEDQY